MGKCGIQASRFSCLWEDEELLLELCTWFIGAGKLLGTFHIAPCPHRSVAGKLLGSLAPIKKNGVDQSVRGVDHSTSRSGAGWLKDVIKDVSNRWTSKGGATPAAGMMRNSSMARVSVIWGRGVRDKRAAEGGVTAAVARMMRRSASMAWLSAESEETREYGRGRRDGVWVAKACVPE